MAIDIHAAWSEPGSRCSLIVEWHFVVLGECRVYWIGSRNEANQPARHTQGRSPDRAINRTRTNAIERRIDPLVLRWIDFIVDADICVAFAVAVRIENERSPALRLLFVFGLQIDLRIEPAFNHAATRKPQDILIVEIQMVRAEAGVDGRGLFGLRIVKFDLSAALIKRKR